MDNFFGLTLSILVRHGLCSQNWPKNFPKALDTQHELNMPRAEGSNLKCINLLPKSFKAIRQNLMVYRKSKRRAYCASEVGSRKPHLQEGAMPCLSNLQHFFNCRWSEFLRSRLRWQIMLVKLLIISMIGRWACWMALGSPHTMKVVKLAEMFKDQCHPKVSSWGA